MPQQMLEIFQPTLYETAIKNHHLRSMTSRSFLKCCTTDCDKLYVCTSHLHADGQIAKDCVDFQLETLIPVRMALPRQDSPCHLPGSPNHGPYSKTWETGKGVSVTRMDYAHACMKLPKNKSKKKVCF